MASGRRVFYSVGPIFAIKLVLAALAIMDLEVDAWFGNHCP